MAKNLIIFTPSFVSVRLLKLLSLSKFASSKRITPHLISSPVSSCPSQSALFPLSRTPLCVLTYLLSKQCGWCLKSLWSFISHPNSEMKTCYLNEGCHALWTGVRINYNCQLWPALHCKNLRTTNIVYIKSVYQYLWCMASVIRMAWSGCWLLGYARRDLESYLFLSRAYSFVYTSDKQIY